jgi:hypothetical protein
MKLDLLTNATVVDDAIRFVSGQQKKLDTKTDTNTAENCFNENIDQQNNIEVCGTTNTIF